MNPYRSFRAALAAALLFTFAGQHHAGAQQVKLMQGPNDPIGVPQGIHPGRVSWAHAPGAATWEIGNGNWFEDRWNDQASADWLMSESICSLTGEKTAAKAWKALFKSFNATHDGKSSGYSKGQLVAIKANLNNSEAYEDNGEINASPHLLLALLRSLVYDAKVPQECITLFDASRFMTNSVYMKCHAEFPDVKYVDNQGTEGRIKATYTADAIPYSVDNGKLARGLADCAIQADYLINMAILKGHVGQGVTLCGKNWYGTTDINRDYRKNQHNNFSQDWGGKPKYMTFVDFMGHKDLGGKTMLYLIDGLYGCKLVGGQPENKWKMTPFDGDWPCSLFASQDPVAIDAVGMDFIISEFPDAPDVNYTDTYLVEAALADKPRSGTFYDPERDGTGLKSLGIFEHWNNPVEKKYLGIELIYRKK